MAFSADEFDRLKSGLESQREDSVRDAVNELNPGAYGGEENEDNFIEYANKMTGKYDWKDDHEDIHEAVELLAKQFKNEETPSYPPNPFANNSPTAP